MSLCMFRYAFNININLPHDLAFKTSLDGRQALIRCISSEGTKIFSYSPSGDYNWLTEKEGTLMVQVTSYNKYNEALIARTLKYYSDKDMFSGGIIDPVRYSIIEVVFKIPRIESLKNNEYFNEISEWASKLLVHFLQLYNFTFQESGLYVPPLSDSAAIEIRVSDDEMQDGNWLSASFKSYNTIVNWRDPFQLGYRIQNLQDEKVNLFGKRLSEGRIIKLFEQLLLEAKSQSQIFDNHKMSVILVETSFEVFLQEILLEQCEKREISTLPVGRGKNIEKNYRDAIINGNIREDLISTYLKILTGKNIAGSKLYNEWYESTYSLRNDIVHKGKLDVKSGDAERAFNATTNLMGYIWDLLYTN